MNYGRETRVLCLGFYSVAVGNSDFGPVKSNLCRANFENREYRSDGSLKLGGGEGIVWNNSVGKIHIWITVASAVKQLVFGEI